MGVFSYFKRADKAARTVEAQEELIEKLTAQIVTLKLDLHQYKLGEERKKTRCQYQRDNVEKVKKFIGYRNFHNVVGHLWPKVTCHICKFSRPTKCNYVCELYKFTCGKYRNCQSAEKNPHPKT